MSFQRHDTLAELNRLAQIQAHKVAGEGCRGPKISVARGGPLLADGESEFRGCPNGGTLMLCMTRATRQAPRRRRHVRPAVHHMGSGGNHGPSLRHRVAVVEIEPP